MSVVLPEPAIPAIMWPGVTEDNIMESAWGFVRIPMMRTQGAGFIGGAGTPSVDEVAGAAGSLPPCSE